MNYTIKNAPADRLRLEEWGEIDTHEFAEPIAAKIAVLTKAIRDYVQREAIDGYLSDHKMQWTTFLRAFNRCIALDSRGYQFGWRGLLHGMRITAPVRTKPLRQSGGFGRGGLSGALQLLFKECPEIKEDFDGYLISTAKREPGAESKLRHGAAQRKFIALCGQADPERKRWPFGTQKLGRGAIYQYVNAFIDAHYDDIVATQYGNKARAKANSGTGVFSRLTAMRPLDVVELDEYKCHYIGSIGIETPGGWRWLVMPRLVIVAVIDRKLGNVLGYKARFRPEADADDVLDALAMACGHRESHDFVDGEMRHTEGSGFPSSLGPPFDSCGFDQLLMDNALIHIAEQIIGRARALIGCDINFGPLGHPERRPGIEGLFSALSRHGFHRLQPTTGSHPNDPLRQDPERAATDQRMTWSDVLDLIEAIIADHNTRQGKTNFGFSPLQQLKYLTTDAKAGMIFPVLPPLLSDTPSLDTSVVPLTVRGRKETGARPYVYFEEEEYFGTDLSDRWKSVEEDVVGHVRRRDIRKIELFTVKGERLDTLQVRGRWRHSPHSRDLRRYVNKMVRDGYLNVGYDEDPVTIHLAALAKRVQDRLPGARAAAAVHAEEQRARHESSREAAKDAVSEVLDRVKTQNDSVEAATHNATSDVDVDASTGWEMPELRAINKGY